LALLARLDDRQRQGDQMGNRRSRDRRGRARGVRKTGNGAWIFREVFGAPAADVYGRDLGAWTPVLVSLGARLPL
jgi:hypothetical protein